MSKALAETALEHLLRRISPRDAIRSEESTVELLREGGNAAEKAIVLGHFRVAARVAYKLQGGDLEVADLVQEAVLGVMRALEGYDPEKGRFPTYASYWAHQRAKRAIADKSLVRLPVYVVTIRDKVRERDGVSALEDGRIEPAARVAEDLDTSVATVERARNTQVYSESAEVYLQGCVEPVILGDWLRANVVDTSDYELLYAKADLRRLIETSLQGLEDERSRDIVRRRFGLGERNANTLEEIGDDYGVTRDRIRQPEKQALERLRELDAERGAELRKFWKEGRSGRRMDDRPRIVDADYDLTLSLAATRETEADALRRWLVRDARKARSGKLPSFLKEHEVAGRDSVAEYCVDLFGRFVRRRRRELDGGRVTVFLGKTGEHSLTGERERRAREDSNPRPAD